MPPSDFTNMHRIFRSEVRLKVASNNDTKRHKTSLQLCAHGRSLWFLFEYNGSDFYYVLNDRCSVIRGESPDADYVLQDEEKQLAEAAKKKSRWRARSASSMDQSEGDRENIFVVYVREETPDSLLRRVNSSESSLPLPSIQDDEDEVRLIIRCSNKSERDQWISVISGGLYAVRSSTVETLKQSVRKYLESSERARMTFIALRKYIVDQYGQVTFDVNADICEALVKRHLVTMA